MKRPSTTARLMTDVSGAGEAAYAASRGHPEDRKEKSRANNNNSSESPVARIQKLLLHNGRPDQLIMQVRQPARLFIWKSVHLGEASCQCRTAGKPVYEA